MPFQRGDIIEVEYTLNGKDLKHPAIIISNEEVFNCEEYYICAMITHSPVNDLFTFKLEDNMLKMPMPGSQVRCQLIGIFHPKQIIPNQYNNSMKKNSVDRLVAHIQENSLSVID